MQNLKQLLQNNPALSRPEAVLLLAHAIKKDKEYIFARPEYRPTLLERLKFYYYRIQKSRGYSLAAIIQQKEFYGLDFYVNKHVLVPRPETELIVEEVIKVISKQTGDEKTVLIDVGTGSGCIPIAILKNVNKKIETYAVDISARALKVAKLNARTQNVFIKFFHGSLLQPITKLLNSASLEHLIITANLPYLTKEQFDSEPGIQREPGVALVATAHGLAIYEQLLRQIAPLLKIKNFKLKIFMEIDPSQPMLITTIIKQLLPVATVEIKKDLARRDRVVVITI